MPFKTLQKTDSTIDELVGAYVAIKTQKSELEQQKSTAYDAMLKFDSSII